MSKNIIEGKIHVITDGDGNPINDIDTDQIYHNEHLAVTDVDKMGQYAFGNLEGWENFSTEVEEGDILVVGRNFGSGSSRQQAVDCFISLGISGIIGESFGAIYKRNAINSGLPVLKCNGIMDLDLKDGSYIKINLKTGKITGKTGNHLLDTNGFSEVQMQIYRAGGLFEYGSKL